MKILFDKPTDEALRHIADNLRESDIREFRCIFPEGDILVPLQVSVNISRECAVAYQNGVPIVILGIAVDETGNGVPWMASTDEINVIPIKTLRTARKTVDYWTQEYGTLKNYVHKDNHKSIAMLKWLGFTVSSEPEAGMRDDFYPFWRTKPWQ